MNNDLSEGLEAEVRRGLHAAADTRTPLALDIVHVTHLMRRRRRTQLAIRGGLVFAAVTAVAAGIIHFADGPTAPVVPAAEQSSWVKSSGCASIIPGVPVADSIETDYATIHLTAAKLGIEIPRQWTGLDGSTLARFCVLDIPLRARSMPPGRATFAVIPDRRGRLLIDSGVRLASSAPRPATWRIEPGVIRNPKDTELRVLVQEKQCAGNDTAIGRIERPAIHYTTRRVVIGIRVWPLAGGARCPVPPETPFVINLDQPIGQRKLVDAYE